MGKDEGERCRGAGTPVAQGEDTEAVETPKLHTYVVSRTVLVQSSQSQLAMLLPMVQQEYFFLVYVLWQKDVFLPNRNKLKFLYEHKVVCATRY